MQFAMQYAIMYGNRYLHVEKGFSYEIFVTSLFILNIKLKTNIQK